MFSSLISWLRRLTQPQRQCPPRRSIRLAVEGLEERAVPATFTVTNTGDISPAFGIVGGSLRQAILNANATPGQDVIRFRIGSTLAEQIQPQRIRPGSALPAITDSVIITGHFGGVSQIIELDGSLAPANARGLNLRDTADNSAIEGLVINNWGRGIMVQGNNNTIVDNFVGTTRDGNSRAQNTVGIEVNGDNNVIGDEASNLRNVISGNFVGVSLGGSNNVVLGNLIGTNASGTAAVFNTFGVSVFGTNNQVLGNVTSANQAFGIGLSGENVSGNVIRGNKIGVAADGTTALGNDQFGVLVADGAHDNQIGGLDPGAGNIIGFNGRDNVLIGNRPDNLNESPAGAGNTFLSNVIVRRVNKFDGGLLDLGADDGFTANDNLDGDSGPNNLQNSPVLTAAGPSQGATLLVGNLNSRPSTNFQLQVFQITVANNLRSTTLLTTVTGTSNNAGNLPISILLNQLPADSQLVATATNLATRDTSEFSNVVTVSNNPPMIVNDVLTPSIQEGEHATLSGRLVDPDPGNKLTLTVDWGDGTPVKSYHPGLVDFVFEHRYVDDGVYDVHFTWLDDQGGSNSRTRQVVVHNAAPTITGLAIAAQVKTNHRAQLQAALFDPGQHDVVSVTVDWGDGTVETFVLGRHDSKLNTSHRYRSAGQFTVLLTVFDDDGGQNAVSRNISVTE